MITPIRSFKHADSIRRRLRRGPPPTVFSGTIFRLRPRLELMEDRTLLSTFLVSNTADSGPGSLRQAILDSNTPSEREHDRLRHPGLRACKRSPRSPLCPRSPTRC